MTMTISTAGLVTAIAAEDRSQSSRYVSSDVIGYEDLDDNAAGAPRLNMAPFVSTQTIVGWAPYRYGHWVWISPWGWTWVDDASGALRRSITAAGLRSAEFGWVPWRTRAVVGVAYVDRFTPRSCRLGRRAALQRWHWNRRRRWRRRGLDSAWAA